MEVERDKMSFEGYDQEEGTFIPTVSGSALQGLNGEEKKIDFHTISPHFILSNGDKMIFPFSPPILQTTVPSDFVSLLLTEGKKLNRQQDDANFDLAGNLKFGRSFRYKKEFKDQVAHFIIEKTLPLFEIGTELFRAKMPNEINLDDLWINFSERYDFNPPHIHTGNISFVIYVDVPEKIFSIQADSQAPHAGKIVFEYGENFSPYINNAFDVEPYNGLMFIFPSKLRHFVPSYWVDAQRVSVAGNISFNLL